MTNQIKFRNFSLLHLYIIMRRCNYKDRRGFTSGGMAMKIVIVLIVIGISAVCAIIVATAGSEGQKRVAAISAFPSGSAGTPITKSTKLSQESGGLEVEGAIREQNSRIEKSAPVSAGSSAPASSGTASKPAASAAPQPDKNDYDIIANEFLGDPAHGVSRGQAVAVEKESATQEDKSVAERDRIERDMKRLRSEMLKRTNTVASTLKLDQSQRESITQITEQTLTQIRMVREQFASSQMTDYDKEVMRSQIQDAYRAAGENIRYVLGDEKYKEFRKESSYYNNPNLQLHDVQKSMDEQKKQLDRIERSTRFRERNSGSRQPESAR